MKKKYKIANIIEEGFFGGPQRRIINTTINLDKKFETTVIFPIKDSQIFKELLIKKKINIHQLSINKLSLNLIIFLKYILFFFIDIYRIYKFLKKKKFDIVHISGGAWQVKGVIAAKLNKIKIIWQLNDTYLPYLLRLQFKFLYKMSDGIIYSSYSTKKYYSSIIKDNILYQVIPSSVDTAEFNPEKNFEINSNYKKIINNKFVVTMIANINKIKGIDDFLKLANEFNKVRNDNIVFLLICNVPKNQKKLYNHFLNFKKKLNITNFYFLNSVGDVRSILKLTNIYICLSKYESSPVSVWEALSMGKFVVSYDVGDIRKYIENNTNGFIVSRSLHDVMKKIIKVYSISNNLKFNKFSRLKAIEELDIKMNVSKLNYLYEKIINK